ncbi:hypothetical protein [Evansella cellulosilytica]|uniref:Uncharacterized protein n=1 Tax=Evansella cellulosilytica (strain ATCC 21833 / DSM 2522 / FERM P-1141 / JCM 9156 / N-4) TaxID=649639 RepID=E6TUV1_EVAC2|nr:hypothetical protein [Evansella cellulosilytica]ADU32103.1 hypothetical protein Bcell_3864 [Evansella cellulosilytica DSM 2522]
MYFYCIKDHLKDSDDIFISTTKNVDEVKNIILFMQAKVNVDISEEIYLNSEDIVQLLIDHYDCARKTVIDSSKPIEMIELVQLWNDNIENIERIVLHPDNQQAQVEDAILKRLEKHAKFLFINAAVKLPKWAENTSIEPLTLQVTHNGVLIQGLSVLTEEERGKMLQFYPASKFYGNHSLFFSFKDFPPYEYSFSWNGKHVTVMHVHESDHAATEIKKQMNIGYYLTESDLNLPINSLTDLQKLKTKMRLG